jgi:uncharacterized membrane protein
MHYLLLKLVHVAAVVLFLGNITLGLFWMRHAMRSGDRRIVAHTMDGVIRSDRWFTSPMVVVIIAAGIAAAMQGQLGILRTGWIAWSLYLFAFSGLVFMAVLIPLQRRIRDYAASAPEFDVTTCRAMVRRWDLWGLMALVPVWVALALMVLKHPA